MDSVDSVLFRNKLELDLVKILESKWNCKFVHTVKEVGTWGFYSAIDGFMFRDNIENRTIVSLIENRTRKETIEQIVNLGGIFINYEKFEKIVQLSENLRVPTIFVAYFFNEKPTPQIRYWEIVDKLGNIIEHKKEYKLAQDTLEKGVDIKKERWVAILDNEAMKKLEF